MLGNRGPDPLRAHPRASSLRNSDRGNSRPSSIAAPDSNSRPTSSRASTVTLLAPTRHVERVCNVWVHEEAFSKEDVVLDIALFPKGTVRVGDLGEIAGFNTTTAVRDFQDAAQSTFKETGGGRSVAEGTSIEPASTLSERKLSGANILSLDESRGSLESSRDVDPHKKYCFIIKDITSEQRAKYPNLQVSVSSKIANRFGFKNRTKVLISTIDKAVHTASHIEISFRDEYLTRADMWRLAISELSHKTVYRGQKLLFMGTIKATVKNIYVRGRKTQSAYFSGSTKPLFRSESARFVLFIQMSKEMWDFDPEGGGDIMFNKVINGFLPELFKRWVRMNARHLVSIVLFTRLEYDKGAAAGFEGLEATRSAFINNEGNKLYKDHYRVVVSDMSSGEWASILFQLKKEFKIFLREVSIQRTRGTAAQSSKGENAATTDKPETIIAGHPSAAIHGNILEAVYLGSRQFSSDYIDRDLVRTGISLVIITPGVGLFEVDYNMLKMTSETLVNTGIGLDLVCLSRPPLHSVPLFKYRNPQVQSRLNDHNHQYRSLSASSTPRQHYPIFGSLSTRERAWSPSRFSEGGFSPRHLSKLAAGPRPGEWTYAVPHWIDVSFWNSTSDETLGTMDDDGLKLQQQPRHRRLNERKAFITRCKMYELQMMGIMENEMSNIAIPFLHDSPGYPRDRNLLSQPTALSFSSQHSYTDTGTGSTSPLCSSPTQIKMHRPSKTGFGNFGRLERDHQYSSQDKEAFKWMDVYDDLVFRSLAQRREMQRASRHKAQTEEQRGSLSIPEDEAAVTDRSGRSPGGLNAPTATTFFDRKMKERQVLKDPANSRRDSMASTMNLAPPAKPARLSRQISFGLRGFGTAAPKATASTEVTSENARPGQLFSSGFSFFTKKQEPNNNMSSSSSSIRPEDPAFNGDSPGSKSPTSGSSVPENVKQADEPSQPIAIKTSTKPASESSQTVSKPELKERKEPELLAPLQAASINRQAGPKIDLTPSVNPVDDTSTLSPAKALSPWLTTLNPCNPKSTSSDTPSQFRRWQYLYPRASRYSSIKWKSLCSPAATPLTTEYFPTAEQLANEYQESPYHISPNDELDLPDLPRTRESLMRELIAFRLSHGFQIVVGPAVAEAIGKPSLKMVDVFDSNYTADDGSMVFMSLGSLVHQLLCVEGDEVEVKRFVRKPTAALGPTVVSGSHLYYTPVIQTWIARQYEPRQIPLAPPKDDYNWNFVDTFLAGYESDFTDHLRFWRTRFVLIPLTSHANPRRHMHLTNEDNEEEVRLEGIRKLTQVWQRHRYVSPEERQFQAPSRTRKDPNPLDIIYQTRDPSDIVTAELDSLSLAEGDAAGRQSQLLPDTEPFQRANVNLSLLAKEIQGERGVKMVDRRWHWRLHYNCFIGFDLTTWLLNNFKDVDTREEAVELGNELMKSGLFQHVDKRHQFRDGNFFYQLTPEYRSIRPESRGGWFAARRFDKSVPSTPLSETARDSPRGDRSRSSSNAEDVLTDSGQLTPTKSATTTTTTTTTKKLKVSLSRMMKYDVDPRRRSYRAELINLHYDRLHNPDSCYHIRLEWMNVTSKLIEDAIVSWANIVEKYGLRLVEVPIEEASCITRRNPFRSPYPIKLALPPPATQPHHYFDTAPFATQPHMDKFYFHKAILKRFNFVLDLEAAGNFPDDVDVSYSWGKPDYRYSQYIHRSGTLLAQITDEGEFLLLANRLYNNSPISSKEIPSRFSHLPTQQYSGQKSEERSVSGLSAVSAGITTAGGAGSSTTSVPNVSGNPSLGDRRAMPAALSSTSLTGSAVNSGRTSLRQTPFASPMVRPAASPMLRAVPDTSFSLANFPANTNYVPLHTTPEKLKDEFEAFCISESALERFYEDTIGKLASPSTSTPMLEASIPSLALPQSLMNRFALTPSPSPSMVTATKIPAPPTSAPHCASASPSSSLSQADSAASAKSDITEHG
ncbi:hypothetical protein L228DRAFT_246048 [Xylona heveae TC161]|uniref:Vacuolar membrane-associated protein IML1 n=1 Tax=Xylona heveae (strain CBS 132557 / TC161) TaxID=1328760 RepID=A0A165HCE8_XYLHT|nr:hypothetical protein L228DRAFT_246048 [Xylona heveae TC161]KZF23293.1 hypothetical protein L228DRAFT_246048 [Xylona heveae TC161]